MALPSAASCPGCSGPWWPEHPAGVLTYQHAVTCPILRDEDATRHADNARARAGTSTRPATPAELQLLDALGYTRPASPVIIRVEPVTRSVVRRVPLVEPAP